MQYQDNQSILNSAEAGITFLVFYVVIIIKILLEDIRNIYHMSIVLKYHHNFCFALKEIVYVIEWEQSQNVVVVRNFKIGRFAVSGFLLVTSSFAQLFKKFCSERTFFSFVLCTRFLLQVTVLKCYSIGSFSDIYMALAVSHEI